jgi:Flp pilus assembly pilin Flp
MKQYLVGLWKDESGQDTAEYALLLLLIALALIAAITGYKDAIANVFSRTGAKLEGTAEK